MHKLFPDRLALAAGLAALIALPAHAADISAQELRGGVFLFQGAGANVVAMADGADLLVVDGGLEENSADLYAAIQAATGGERIAALVNTHWHPEQVGLNDEAARDGAAIVAHEVTRMYLANTVTSPLFEGQFGPLDASAQPNAAGRSGGDLAFAGRTVEYGYLPAAHTDGDLYVFFPEQNVLVAGGAVGSDAWPLLDYWNGGLIGGLVRAHETLAARVSDDTIVVPAHGPVMTGAELKAQVGMYQQLFRDLNYLMNHGMGYNDVVALNPLQGREAVFGDPSRFLDGAYRSKQMAYVPD